MKVKNTNELWLLNRTTSDVHIADLGVKVLAGKTINVYKSNPYLTTAQVSISRKTGSLSRRIETFTLIVVKKGIKNVSQFIKNMKESKESNIRAIKTKSSVVLEPNAPADEESDGDFTFADFGVNDIESPVSQTKQEDGSVVVTPKQDEVEEMDSGVELEPVVESGISKQSQVVMKATQDAMIDPTGPHAEQSVPTNSFTVVKPPKPPESEQEPLMVRTPTGQKVSKDESSGAVVVGEKKPRSIQAVKRVQEEVNEDDELGADEVIDFKDTEFGSKKPVKTHDGSVIMQLAENEEEEPEVKKTVVTKKKRTSKKKKVKTSKKKDK